MSQTGGEYIYICVFPSESPTTFLFCHSLSSYSAITTTLWWKLSLVDGPSLSAISVVVRLLDDPSWSPTRPRNLVHLYQLSDLGRSSRAPRATLTLARLVHTILVVPDCVPTAGFTNGGVSGPTPHIQTLRIQSPRVFLALRLPKRWPWSALLIVTSMIPAPESIPFAWV
jgi:hypothetical protein